MGWPTTISPELRSLPLQACRKFLREHRAFDQVFSYLESGLLSSEFGHHANRSPSRRPENVKRFLQKCNLCTPTFSMVDLPNFEDLTALHPKISPIYPKGVAVHM